MLVTFIQIYEKKSFHFDPVLEQETNYDCINTIYQFVKPFLDNKMSMFEEYGAFNSSNNMAQCKF